MPTQWVEPDDMEESDDESSEEEFDMEMETLDQSQLINDDEDTFTMLES